MICSIDERASTIGARVLELGGSAVDAAIATSAALAVTSPHACGMGGDLFALVHTSPGSPACLNASGRSGSLSDPAELRSQGFESIPRHGHPAAVTVPGCVDGWLALHGRFGRLPLDDVLGPALKLARDGFAAGPSLAARASEVAGVPGNTDIPAALLEGQIVHRRGSANALEAIIDTGRDGFYGGAFGRGLRATCPQITAGDLAQDQAAWVDPLHIRAWDHDIWTTPPNSQGYITLAAAALLERLAPAAEPEQDLWAHLGIEASRQAAWDRPAVLHEKADGPSLLAPSRLDARLAAIKRDTAAALPGSSTPGGTIYLCVVDDHRAGVSLIQSNAQGFGAGLVAGDTGIFLHNRGLAFSLEPEHPAEYRPLRRPPHTLSPALVTRPGGTLRTVLGTMGGDAQPQVVLQLLARLLHAGQTAQECIEAPRWRLDAPGSGDGFSTWSEGGHVQVALEAGAPDAWAEGLRARGHAVTRPGEGTFGHAHMIDIGPMGSLFGAADPRAPESAAV